MAPALTAANGECRSKHFAIDHEAGVFSDFVVELHRGVIGPVRLPVDARRSGKLRPLAVSTATRSPFMPDIPTMKEAGLPDVENTAWMAVMAPASTPTAIVERMNKEINEALQMPEVREKLASMYMQPGGGTSADLAKFMHKELVTMTPVIKRSGASID